jgi:hypothetical protein
MPPVVIRVLWGGAILLVIVGLTAAIGRGVFMNDIATRGEPLRMQIMEALHRDDPFAQERAAELVHYDSRFSAHPLLTLLHIIPGGIFLILAPLQFSRRIRRRHIQFHRWSGRLLVLSAFVTALSALYFGLLMPYGGPGEAAAMVVFGGLFLVSVTRAFIAIRTHQVVLHREWMIRAFAVAIGISAIRVVGGVLDVALTPAGFRAPEIFVLSIWTGWVITLGFAELWLRHTRARISKTVPAES